MIRCICRIQGIEILNDTVYRYMMIYNQMPQLTVFHDSTCQVPRPKQAPRRRPRWPPLERPKAKPRQIAEEPVAFWHQRLGPRRSEIVRQTYVVCFFVIGGKKEGASFFFLGRDLQQIRNFFNKNVI